MTNSLRLLYVTSTFCVTVLSAFTINLTSGALADPLQHYVTNSTDYSITPTPSTTSNSTIQLGETNGVINDDMLKDTSQLKTTNIPTRSIPAKETTAKPRRRRSNTPDKTKQKPLQSLSTDKSTTGRQQFDTSDNQFTQFDNDEDDDDKDDDTKDDDTKDDDTKDDDTKDDDTTDDDTDDDDTEDDDDDEIQFMYRQQQIRYYKQLYSKFIERVPGMVDNTGERQPASKRCVRKEYRMLTDKERNRFTKAINILKQDTSVSPNKYDALAIIHSGPTLDASHRGPGFLGWHRIYLMIFETALQEVDPDLCLSYWDTTIESQLEEPWLSSLWSSELLGSPEGPVLNGPFANWTTPEDKPLTREVGQDGLLFTPEIIHDILSRYRQEDITTSKRTKPRFDFESFHEGVHSFSGGAMKVFATAAFDPTFYLLHTFIDYVWSLFRTHLKQEGIDPEIFPNIRDVTSLHEADALTGFGNLTHSDGYLEVLAQSVTYIPSPQCSSNNRVCGSRYLECQVRTGRCIPTLSDEVISIDEAISTPATDQSTDFEDIITLEE